MVVNENREIVDETRTPRKLKSLNNNTKIESVQKLQNIDDLRSSLDSAGTIDLRSSLDSAGGISVRRESSIVVSVPTSRSDMEKVSETEEEDATEIETENDNETPRQTANEEDEDFVYAEGNMHTAHRARERQKKKRKLKRKKSSVTNKVKPKSPGLGSERPMSTDANHGIPMKPGSPKKSRASDKLVSVSLTFWFLCVLQYWQ